MGDHKDEYNSFEDALYSDLNKPSSGWISNWANSPLGIWFLTSASVAILSVFYTNYSSCRTLQLSDNDQISKIVYELSGRERLMREAYKISGDIKKRREALRKTKDPDRFYSFEEFKGHSIIELEYRARCLFDKWSLWTPQASIDNDAFTLQSIGNVSVDRGGSRFVDVLAKHAKIMDIATSAIRDDESENEVVLNVVAQNLLNQDSDAISRYAQAQSHAGFVAPSECIRRTIWPF